MKSSDSLTAVREPIELIILLNCSFYELYKIRGRSESILML